MMRLTVSPGDWGDAQHAELERLLWNVVFNFYSPIKLDKRMSICVEPSSVDHPWTPYRRSDSEPFTVYLSARDRHWAKFAYQFAHELCHVLSNLDRLKASKNRWLHESLCETASIFVLKRMARGWDLSPPYQHWRDYSKHLADYAENLIFPISKQESQSVHLPEWLGSLEDIVREDSVIREINAVVAYKLLPLFESNPAGWRTVQRLPASSSCILTYLQEWQENVDPKDKRFVQKISRAFQ